MPRPRRGIRLKRDSQFDTRLETKSGVKVRSKAERVTANYLYLHKIRFQYEPLILLGERQFRPDFYLPDHDLFLEICGFTHMPYYNDRSHSKEKIYEMHNLNAVFVHYTGRGSLRAILRDKLSEAGIELDGEP